MKNLINMLPRQVRIVLVLILSPIVVMRTIQAVLKLHKNDAFAGLDEQALESQILIPVLTWDAHETAKIRDAALAFMAEDRWEELAEMYRDAEQSLEKTPQGSRHYQIVLNVALHEVRGAIAGQTGAHPADMLERLEGVHLAHPENYALALFAARGHLDLGWAYRGSGCADDVSEAAWKRMMEHYERATEILDGFDAEELRSPGIAAAIHVIARQAPDNTMLKRVYEVWHALDPANVDIYQQHAFHLLPRWGGTYEEVELAARRAAATTNDMMGMGAYALFYGEALSEEPGLMEVADPALFREAVNDYLASKPDHVVVNTQLKRATEMMTSAYMDAELEALAQPWRMMARDLCRDIIQKHLHAVVHEIWNGDASDALYAVAAVFREEIEAGNTLEFSDEGMVIQPPAA
ncbi:MAG: hypothetical protein HUJ27_03050 [Rhodobacteraceae bacterium]|nr:hypothetical protein [Paracoccaceae bacterium]